MFKDLIQKYLENRTKKYLKKHKPILVAVTGSVGKTSTKTAIATVLGEKYRVRIHSGNHNTHMSVPLAILGVTYPDDIRSIKSWWMVFQAVKMRISQPKDVDVIVQELGSDHPGDVAHFGKYLRPDYAVVTAVSPEHMENFHTLEAVAKEELSIAKFAKHTLVNRDDVDEKFANLAVTRAISTYGLGEKAEYRMELDEANPLEGKMGQLITPEWPPVSINLQLIGDHSVKSAVAGAAIATKMGMTSNEVAVGLAKIVAVPGRMQLLAGANESLIIDDTYNSSPLAASAALKTLQEIDSPKRVVIFGSMNELGAMAQEAHIAVAEHCDPSRLEFLVTVGDQANSYLAPAAKKKGIQVKTCTSPYEAGGFVRAMLSPGTVVLVKGSQNGVFTEEAIKVLLRDVADEDKLVRQSPQWMKIKQEQFSSHLTEIDD